MARNKSFTGSRARVKLGSELDELAAEMTALQRAALPAAEAMAVGQTLECVRDKLQDRFNKTIEGGPANRFVSENTMGWNVGRFGRVSTGARLQPVSLSAYQSTRSGRVFIQDAQERIFEDSLSGGVVTNRTNVSGRSTNPQPENFPYIITVPRNIKNVLMQGDTGSRKLLLKYDRKGNIVRFRQGAFKQLRAAALANKRGNNPAKWGDGPFSKYSDTDDASRYFEVTRETTTPSGRKLLPGIYRRETNKAFGDRLQTNLVQVVSYRQKVNYTRFHKQFDFYQIALPEIEKEFDKKMGRALDAEMRKLGF